MVTLKDASLPERIRVIPQPPGQLYIIGANLADLLAKPCVCIVGSRKVSAYGKQITARFAGELAQAGVVIISGLAIGVDSIAHRAVLDAGGHTIAVLPSGLDAVYPTSHRGLARQIIAQGGALVTEYPPHTRTYPSNFIARNRIASGLSNAVIITEAAERSGTLSTARFALEQGRELLAIPGNITSPTSVGTNTLIKAGAAPITCTDDILHILGMTPAQAHAVPRGGNPQEQLLLDLMHTGQTDGAQLLASSTMDVSLFNQTLTMLEIKGLVRPLGGNQWATI